MCLRKKAYSAWKLCRVSARVAEFSQEVFRFPCEVGLRAECAAEEVACGVGFIPHLAWFYEETFLRGLTELCGTRLWQALV